MGFDFDPAMRRELGYKLIDCINRYFSSLTDRPVQLPAAERTFGSLTDKMPEFGGRPSNTPTDNLAPDPLQTDSPGTSALLGAFRGGLHVSLKPNTRIVEIRYTSTNPQLSADIVNTLANTYVEQNFKTKFESTMQASDWLSKQLVDLQIKVETSQDHIGGALRAARTGLRAARISFLL